MRLNQDLKELIFNREEEMMKTGYSFERSYLMRKYWKEFYKYSLSHNIDYYCSELYELFLKEKYGYIVGENSINSKQNEAYRAKIILDDFELYKTCSHKAVISKQRLIKLSNYYENVLNTYLNECKKNYNSESTLYDKNTYTRAFLKFLEGNNIFDCKNINKMIINKYLKESIISQTSLSNIRIDSWILREILKYLYRENYVDIDFSYLVPSVRKIKNKSVPNIWSKEEIEKFTSECYKAKTPLNKRDCLMLLLAIRYGIRKSDILNLKFSNINWDKNEINIIQVKTQKKLMLPLTNEIGLLILDYVKNYRPPSTEKYIFIRHAIPFIRLNPSFSFNAQIKYIAKNCNIILKYKKGIHSFRHTIASVMLKNETPLNIISSSLGHTNTKSTEVYLKVDIENLRNCMLENINEI